MMADELHDDRTQTHVILIKSMMVSHYRIIEKIGGAALLRMIINDSQVNNNRDA